MSFRVNNDGFRVDHIGNVVETSQADREKFKALVDAAWLRNHRAETVPEDQAIMIVEKGDSQWAIAQSAGADPVTTAYQMNEQFGNPDLIYPGDVVFVDRTTIYGEGAHGGNIGLFGDRVVDDTSRVSNGSGPDHQTQFDGVRMNIENYLDTVPAEKWNVTAESLIFDYDWGMNDEGLDGRQLTIEAYLNRLDEEHREMGVERLDALADQLPDGPVKRAIMGAIDNAARKVIGA